jgi:nitrate/nitrite-specific signal transduction histidine kinase
MKTREDAVEDAVEHVKLEDFERLAKSQKELGAHVIALTAVVGSMATALTIDYERLEESVNFAAKQLRPSHRSILLAEAATMLQDLEVMQKVLRVETRKRRNRRRKKPNAG